MVKEYFEIKREIVADNLKFVKGTLESLDGKIKSLKDRYDYDLEILNKKVKRFQEIEVNDTKRLKELEKKIADGYRYIDMATGKAYKTEKGATNAVKSRTNRPVPKDKEEVSPPEEIKKPKKKNKRQLEKERLEAELEALEDPKESLDELLDKPEE